MRDNPPSLEREIRLLRQRIDAAYAQEDDDTLLKILASLFKAVEVQHKIAGSQEDSRVELVLRGAEVDDAP